MNNKLSMTFRLIFCATLFILTAGLFTTTTVQSADPYDPTLTVIKTVVNDNGGTVTDPNTFVLTVDSIPVLSGATNAFEAGPHTVAEMDLVGYSAGTWGGNCNADGTITLVIYQDAICTITNDDVGFNITPTTSLITSESGIPTATFDVVLDTAPSANVTLALNSSDLTEGTIDKPSLTFTPADWFTPQTVTITGVDDFVADGDKIYSIVTGLVTSLDPDYASLSPGTIIPDVSVTNSDDDIPGYTITPNTDLWTSEGGASETIQILLRSRPTSPVLLNIVSSNIGEGTISPSSLTFNPDPWPPLAPKEFTVTGVDDCKNGGDNYTVTITGTSLDPNYNGRQEILQFTNHDAPTIEWVEPVGTEEIYYADGFSPIDLEVISVCPEPISKVRFYRWVEAVQDWVTIGEDLTPPYEERLLAGQLEPIWTQVFAFAFSPPNPVQTFSDHERILILNENQDLIVLPLINK